MLGLDYAGGRPGGAAIAAAGYGFVCRYLSDGGPGLPGKLLTAAEYADLMAHGVAVVVNWETTADRMKGGRAAGVADADRAGMQTLGVGHPQDRPIYFSADWDATPADQAAIDEYLRGAASVIGPTRVGVYGSYYVCKRCLDGRTAAWAWQTGAWSGGQRESRAHIYQRIGFASVGGVQCDVNEALIPDFGQHLQEDDMQPDERDALYDIREQMTGSRSSRPPQYPGWPAHPDASDKAKTMVDYVRAVHARQGDIETKLDAILAQLNKK
ncbi:MAG: glycoside hydrolase domain-containing protein [Pseudonocardiaceae bacterium]